MAIRALSQSSKFLKFSSSILKIIAKTSHNPSPLSNPQFSIQNLEPYGPNFFSFSRLYHDGRPRGPLWRGKKMIGKEALFVILGMKRFKDDEEKLSKFVKSHVKRLLKMDMIAVLTELERQEEVELALKMSKESTLIDAIDYIQKLQEQIYDLKLELSKISEEDGEKQGSASNTESMAPPELIQCPGKVEVSGVGRNKFHVKIECKNKPGGFVGLLEAIARNGLEITEISSFAFSGFVQIVFSAEAKGDKEVPTAELRKLLMVIVGASKEKCHE